MLISPIPLNTSHAHTQEAKHYEEFLYRAAIIAAALMLLATVFR